jgi:hypothetical protein
MISAQIRAQVRERAHNACEYCHLHQDDSPLAALHVEHIIPKIHGGSDDVENLALACIDCNLHKGTNLTGFDPETNVITELFHPRPAFVGRPFSLAGTLSNREDSHWQDYYSSAEYQLGRSGGAAFLVGGPTVRVGQ